ncbi:MAG: phosphohistidine phosphatase SixA [Gammaproteobacteria bacterium]|nr:MAG: phosphohistidine phosphatase SixA [Gammaproteobacteria bacterium]
MRHGNAEHNAQSDSARQLTRQGIAECEIMAQVLAPNKSLIRKIIASPYIRAQQSAQVMSDALGGLAIETSELITPDIPSAFAVRELEALVSDGALLVSHLPLVSSMVSLLVDGHSQASYPFVTASCAHLNGEYWSEGGLSLQQFFHP